MAWRRRRRSRNRRSERDAQRDHDTIARDALLELDRLVEPEFERAIRRSRPSETIWSEAEDRRLWTPHDDALDFDGVVSKVVYELPRRTTLPSGRAGNLGGVARAKRPYSPRFSSVAYGVGPSFKFPAGTVACARRKERREVIFAKGKSGKGARSRRHYNELSEVKCSRY